MVCAKLHIICGNCGCNDMFTYRKVKADKCPETGEIFSPEDVFIFCKNCATLHSLNNNAVHEVKK